MAQKFITYKQRPLVRMGNLIFYGDQNEKCYVMMSILDTQNKGDLLLWNIRKMDGTTDQIVIDKKVANEY